MRRLALEHARTPPRRRAAPAGKPEHAADDVGHAPIEPPPRQPRDDRAENADGRDDHRAVAAQFAREHFGNERHAAAEFAGEADAGEHAPERVSGEGVHKGIRDCRRRIQRDGAEKQQASPLFVAQDAPEDPAEEHAGHLPVEQQQAELAGREIRVAGRLGNCATMLKRIRS